MKNENYHLTDSKSSWTFITSSLLTDSDDFLSDCLPIASGEASSSVKSADGMTWNKNIVESTSGIIFSTFIVEIFSGFNLPHQRPVTPFQQEEKMIVESPQTMELPPDMHHQGKILPKVGPLCLIIHPGGENTPVNKNLAKWYFKEIPLDIKKILVKEVRIFHLENINKKI